MGSRDSWKCDLPGGGSGLDLEVDCTNEMGEEIGVQSERILGMGCVSGRNMNDIRMGGVLRGREGVVDVRGAG